MTCRHPKGGSGPTLQARSTVRRTSGPARWVKTQLTVHFPDKSAP